MKLRAVVWAALWVAVGGGACSARAAAPGAATPEVTASSSAVQTISSIYSVEKMRDPFVKSAAGASAGGECDPNDFSIHQLSVRAMMQDPESDYALLTDACGAVYVFRRGRLYDSRWKAVPNVTGKMNITRKSLTLQTPDKDVQVFRLGEEEGDKE